MSIFTNWLENRKKYKHLSKLVPNTEIYINCIEGYYVNVDNEKIPDYPFKTKVISNDPYRKLLWISFSCNNKDRYITLTYKSKELRNYMLFNVYTKKTEEKKPPTKKEIEKQLEKAVNSGNYEFAALLNKQLVKLKQKSHPTT